MLPGLYVGNYRDSKDYSQLDKYGITHIVAIHDAARRLHPDKHYLCVLASDSPDENITQYFTLCNDFIHAARLRDGNVLIHCLAGMSRSVTVAVAYIMSVTSLSWKEALKVVRAGRSVANPNSGFQRQLQDWETCGKLTDERKRLKERFPSLALARQDHDQCIVMLDSYERLLSQRDICEGTCPLGQTCPTGLCRAASELRRHQRQSGSRRRVSRSAGDQPLSRSPSSTSVQYGRPRYAASYTSAGSAPPSRSSSRVDLYLPGAAGPSALMPGGSTTAPCTPRSSPPVSPRHWPRRSPSVASAASLVLPEHPRSAPAATGRRS